MFLGLRLFSGYNTGMEGYFCVHAQGWCWVWGGVKGDAFLRSFGTFTVGKGIVSVTINIVVNKTFNGVISSIITSIVVPPLKLLINKIGFASLG